MSSLLLQRPVTKLKMAINSWLEKVPFYVLHPLSGRLFVLNCTYEWEHINGVRCHNGSDMLCLNMCEVKTCLSGNTEVNMSTGEPLNTSPNHSGLFFLQFSSEK